MEEQKYYESVAEELNLWTLSKRHNRYFQDMIRYDRILKNLPKQPQKILDLGCGDGYLSFLMAQQGHQVVSLDLSLNRLKKFRDIAREYGIEQKIGDVKQTGLKDQSFDVIVTSEVLEHIEGYPAVLLEAARLLKANGVLIITVPHDEPQKLLTCPHCLKQFYRDGHVNRFNRENLKNALIKQKYDVLQTTVFRSKILNQMQYHLKLKYGTLIKLMDSILSAIFPKRTLYLMLIARKPAHD